MLPVTGSPAPAPVVGRFGTWRATQLTRCPGTAACLGSSGWGRRAGHRRLPGVVGLGASGWGRRAGRLRVSLPSRAGRTESGLRGADLVFDPTPACGRARGPDGGDLSVRHRPQWPASPRRHRPPTTGGPVGRTYL